MHILKKFEDIISMKNKIKFYLFQSEFPENYLYNRLCITHIVALAYVSVNSLVYVHDLVARDS